MGERTITQRTGQPQQTYTTGNVRRSISVPPTAPTRDEGRFTRDQFEDALRKVSRKQAPEDSK